MIFNRLGLLSLLRTFPSLKAEVAPHIRGGSRVTWSPCERGVRYGVSHSWGANRVAILGFMAEVTPVAAIYTATSVLTRNTSSREIQTKASYPAPISVIAYSYLFGATIMGAASYFLVHDPSAWIVGWNGDLIAILYDGIMSSALNFGLVSWALSKVGPLFVASYIPVQPVSSTVLALIFLKSSVYLGSVLGTVLIILGLLLVSWSCEEAMRLTVLSRIVEQSGRLPRVTAHVRDPELTSPLLQV